MPDNLIATPLPASGPTPIEQDFTDRTAQKSDIASNIAYLNGLDEPTRNKKLAEVGKTPQDFAPYLSDVNKANQKQQDSSNPLSDIWNKLTTPPADFANSTGEKLGYQEYNPEDTGTLKEMTPSPNVEDWKQHPFVQGLKAAGLAAPEADLAGQAGSDALGYIGDKLAPNHPYIGKAARFLGGVAGVILSSGTNAEADASAVSKVVDATKEGVTDQTKDTLKETGADLLDKGLGAVTKGAVGVPEIQNAANLLSPEALLEARGGTKSVNDAYMQALNEKYPLHFGQVDKSLDQPAFNSKDIASLDLEQHQNMQTLSDLAQQFTTAAKAGDQDTMNAIRQHFADNLAPAAKSAALYDKAMSGAGQSLQIGKYQSTLAKTGQQILQDSGSDSIDDVIRGFATLSDKADKVASQDRLSYWMNNVYHGDFIHNAIMDAQLWNPRIPAEKLLTDVGYIPYQAAMRSVATAVRFKSLSAGAKMFTSQTDGYLQSLVEGWRFAKQSAASGAPAFENAMGIKDAHTFAGDDFGDSVPSLGHGMMKSVGRVYGLGKNAVLALDQWDKTITNRMGINSQALYKALTEAEEKGLSGSRAMAYAEPQAAKYVAAMPSWLKNAAKSSMNNDSFTDDDAFTKTGMGMANAMPFGHVIAPWVRTPINIIEQGMINSPAAPMTAKFMRDVTGSDELAGLTDRAKMALGSSLFGLLVRRASSGLITGDGPSDPKLNKEWQDAGNVPRSFKLGKNFHGYQHMPVFSTALALAANFSQYSGEMPDHTRQSYANMALKLFGNMAVHGPFLESVLQTADALHEIATTGAQSKDVRKWAGQMTSQIVPQPVAETAKLMAPYEKEIQGFEDVWKSKVPGLSSQLAPRRDWQGKLQYIPPGLNGDNVPPHWWQSFINDVNPVPTYYPQKLDKVDEELIKNGTALSRIPDTYAGPDMYNNPNSPKAGIPISAHLQDRIATLAGNELKIDGKNQHDFLENKINSPYYQSIDKLHPDPDVAKYIKNGILEGIHTGFKQKAMAQVLMKENPDFRQQVIQQKATRMKPVSIGVE